MVQKTLTLLSRASGRADGFGGGRLVRDTSSSANFELDIGDEEFSLSAGWKDGPLTPDDGGICGRGDGSLWPTKRFCILFEHDRVMVGRRSGFCAERHGGITEARADFCLCLFLQLGDGRRNGEIVQAGPPCVAAVVPTGNSLGRAWRSTIRT